MYEVVQEGLTVGLALTVGDDGAIHGATVYPYAPGYGAFGPVAYNGFRVDHGTFTLLDSLPLPVELQLEGFTRGGDGTYYGLQRGDCGECSFHQIVRVTGAGARTVLHSDLYPMVRLEGGEFWWLPFSGADGEVYALRGYGDAPGDLARLDSDGVWSFPAGPARFSVLLGMIAGGWRSNLALGGDGLIYGIDEHDYGSVFRIDRTGAATTLHSFSGYDGTDGAYPLRSLTLGRDGAIYGLTRSGGGIGAGTIFRVDQDGTFTSLHAFGGTDGAYPEQPLMLARNGAIYGASGALLFRIDGATVTSFPILPFTPRSALVQGNDCALYGWAERWVDGPGPTGVIYRVFEPGSLCQEIDFAPLPDRIFGDPSFSVSASSSSGLPVSFAASGSCKVSGTQVVLTRGGPCTVTASQRGDASYSPAAEIARSFNVSFSFAGFLRPIENPPALNRVHAGATVPIRFLLDGRPHGNVIAADSCSVQRIDCDTLEAMGAAELARCSNLGKLHRPRSSSPYTILWKTDPRWAGTCCQLTLGLIDGTNRRASFAFRR